MRNSMLNFWFVGAMAVLLAVSASIVASADGVPPGAAGDGDVPLGDGGTDDGGFSIQLDLSRPELLLSQGNTATSDDHVTITAPSAWMVTVEDANIATSTYDGKMRKGSLGVETWTYDNSEVALQENFGVLLQGIGHNNDLTVPLFDADDLSSPKTIITGPDACTGLVVCVRYSQAAVTADQPGAYRIDLKYTLGSNS